MSRNLGLLTKLESSVYSRRRYVPLVAAVLLALAAVWNYSGKNSWFWGPPLGVFSGTDFKQILRASSEIAAGENPYQHSLEYGRTPGFSEFMTWDASPYPYAPLPAVLARPLLALLTDDALKIWTIVNWALIVGSALIAVAAFRTDSLARGVMPFVFILALFYLYRPVQVDLQLAQMDILILFLLLLTYWLYRHGLAAAALPLAFAIALKPIVVPMLLFFVWKRQWRIAALGVVIAGLLTAYGFFVAGWRWLPSYMQVNLLWASGPMLAYPFNQSPTGFIQRLLTANAYIVPLVNAPLLGRGLSLLMGLLAIGLWIKNVSHTDDRDGPRSMIEYGLTLTTIALFSPLFEDIHFVWLLMPLSALLLVTLGDLQNRRGAWLLLGGLIIALYLSTPLLHKAIYYGWDNLAQRNTLVVYQYGPLTGAYLYGLLALEACLIWYLVRARRPPYSIGNTALFTQQASLSGANPESEAAT
jgi:hypothetical protein